MDVETVRELRTERGSRLLAEVAAHGTDPGTLLATVTALRRSHPADLVNAAVTQVRLRERARAKFGPVADRMFFTPDGLEQATRASVAAHRARRYADTDRVLDLCCGVGGDLVALAGAGLRVRGVDHNPVALEVARANAEVLGLADRIELACGDVTAEPLDGWAAAFCDPARRGGGRRVFDPAAYSPPFAFLATLAATVPATGAKVAPGIPHELVPDGVEAEWVSDSGAVKEAALWWPALATARRRATLLPGGHTLTSTGAEIGAGPVGRYLYEPDGAVIRAGLVAETAALLDGRLLDPTIAYVTTDRLGHTPFATGYTITDVLPFSLKRLRALLRARGVGSLTVKKRGSAIEPETLRRDLRLSGSERATVVLTRLAGAPTVLLVEPLATCH
ncbi:MAG: methyltransferase domain-containing protein [Actinobacteria bacterium]|nr:methyltransferase domain-containing protein [Actinomycetota bacterium]MBI3686768.1 methyltransferase domain-containing protein [Actinomycetota bacterium]